ncbi:MAG: hypothetical protein ACTSVI_14425 [Promethearchaeota archaeon]
MNENSLIENILSNYDSKPINIYQLSKQLGWTYGKTERKINKLIQEGRVYFSYNIENGRMVRHLSLKPLKSRDEINVIQDKVDVNTLQEAFKHLYGIFKTLKAIKKDPTNGLLKYCKDNNLDPMKIINLLDETWRACSDNDHYEQDV